MEVEFERFKYITAFDRNKNTKREMWKIGKGEKFAAIYDIRSAG